MRSQGEHRSRQYFHKILPDSMWRGALERARDNIYARFATEFPPSPSQTVVNVGVSGDHEDPRHHTLESRYPYREQITACGLEPPDLFHRCYPDVRYVRVRRGEPLPFSDREFDVVFCNAVVEHVGSREQQAAFVREVLRVARGAFITTPNRWYPIELHTFIPLAHYLPSPAYRAIYRAVGYDFFAREENLNLMSQREFERLIPDTARQGVSLRVERQRFMGFTSNLLLIARDEG